MQARPGESDEEYAYRLSLAESNGGRGNGSQRQRRPAPASSSSSQQRYYGGRDRDGRYRDNYDYNQQQQQQYRGRYQDDGDYDPPSSPSKSSSDVTCCERCTSCISLWGLHFINVFDSVIGVMILVISLILFTNLGDRSGNFTNAWLAYTCLGLGVMLITVAAFSAMGVSCTCCRCSAVLSGYLAMAVGLICFVLFVIFLAMKPLILEYFEKDGEALGLSDTDIKLTEAWYMVIDIGLFVVSVLELIRFMASVNFYELSHKVDNEGTVSERSPLVYGEGV